MLANLKAIVPYTSSTYGALSLFKSAPSPDQDILNQSVGEIARQKLNSILADHKWDTDRENAFFVADLGEVVRQHLRWKALLPRIEPFFGKPLIFLFFTEKTLTHLLIVLFLNSR